MAETKLQITITAQNLATAELAKLGQTAQQAAQQAKASAVDMKAMGMSISGITVDAQGGAQWILKYGEAAEEAGQKAQKSGMGWKELNQTFFFVQSNIKTAMRIINEVVEFAKAGAQAVRLGNSFEQLASQAGSSSQIILDSLRAASAGTVSDVNLMLASNRAMMLGLGADSQKLAGLMEVARFRGRAMGLDTTQAFNDIVTGVGRMSPMILDNLGIVIDAETRYQQWAEASGRSADSLSAMEKRQILLNAVLEEGQRQITAVGGVAIDSADSYERLGAATENLKTKLATMTNDVLAPHVAKAAEGVDIYAAFLPEFARFVQLSSELAKQEVKKTVGVSVDSTEAQATATQFAKLIPGVGPIVAIAEGFGQVTNSVKELTPELVKVNDELGKTAASKEEFARWEAQRSTLDAMRNAAAAEATASAASTKALDAGKKEANKIAGEIWEERASIAKQYSRRLEDIETQHSRRLADIQVAREKEVVAAAKRIADAQVSFAKARAREAEDQALRERREQEDLARSAGRAAEEYRKQYEDAEKAFYKRLEDLAWDYGRRREDTVYEQAKQWSQAKNAAEYEEMVADQARQLQRMDEEYRHQSDQEREQGSESLSEMEEQFAQRAELEEEDRRIRQEREIEDRAVRAQREAEDFAAQMEQIKEQNEERMASIQEQVNKENLSYTDRLADLKVWQTDELEAFKTHGEALNKLQDEVSKNLIAEDKSKFQEYLDWIKDFYMPQRAEALGLALPGAYSSESIQAASTRAGMSMISYQGQGTSYSGNTVIINGHVYGNEELRRLLEDKMQQYNQQGGISWVGH